MNIQHLDLRDTKLSIYESNITSSDQTTKQTVAAPTEIDGGECFRKIRISNHRREEIKTVDVLDAEIGQSEVNGLKQDEKVDSGLGNAFDGVEANSSGRSTKVVNKEWKTQVDELDQLGVRINSTVAPVVKANQKEDVGRAISSRSHLGARQLFRIAPVEV